MPVSRSIARNGMAELYNPSFPQLGAECKSPVKYKDPGYPTISVSIGGTCVEKALLDLGASVNLLPYSVYKQLGLGELKPTSITLSLTDRSVKIPRGIIEHVLVQVDKFYYPVDFVVLDTDPIFKGTNYVPIILGRPFLATSNAIINCRNGVMQFTFGNMTLELNIFHLHKKHIHPEEEEGPEEVCMIDTLMEEHCDKRMQEHLIESFGDLDEGLPEPSYLLATLPPWKRREEILPLFNEEETQRVAKEEPPKLILKPLPIELKYAYLEEDKKDQPCTHHIYMEDEAKPVRQPQRRLNPHMQEVVRAEVLKLLQVDIIYPISDSPWEVKNPMLQTVHDSELKRRSYSHCKQITPKCCEISLLLREFRSLFVQCYGIPPEATRYMPQAGTLRTSSQPNSKDFSTEDERLSFLSLGVRKAGRHPLVISCELEKGSPRLKISLNGAPTGHKSVETPIGHESNGAVAGDRTSNQMVPLPLPLLGMNQMAPLPGMVPLYKEAMNFMSYVAEVSRGWDEPNARDMERMTSQPKAKGEMYILNDGMDMKAEIAAMERRLEELEMNQMQEVQAISQTPLQAMPCAICLSYEHLVVGDFIEKQEAINAQINQRIDSMESTLNKRMDEMQNDMAQKLDILQESISRLANLNTMQEKENSPSQPYQNSMSIHEMEAQEGESSMVKEIEEVITPRSGKEVDLPTCKLEHKVESETEKENREEIKGKKKGKSIEEDDYDFDIDEEPQRIVIKEELKKKHMPPPFLQALYGKIIQIKGIAKKLKKKNRSKIGVKRSENRGEIGEKTGVCEISQPLRNRNFAAKPIRNPIALSAKIFAATKIFAAAKPILAHECHFAAQKPPFRSCESGCEPPKHEILHFAGKAPFGRVFGSCEADFGTRVPFHSTLRNGCEVPKLKNPNFTAAPPFRQLLDTSRSLPEVQIMHAISHLKAWEVTSPQLQTVLDLDLKRKSYGRLKMTVQTMSGNKLWPFKDKSAKLNGNFAAETPFGRVFRSCETTFGTRVPFCSTVPLILKLRYTCEITFELRNELRNQFWAAKSLLSFEMDAK
uniref:Aspartic peptidase DDI1-type domain-containing protein n=1 Tax=Vitis vinifera TaxID=29760 RepID=A5C4B4_VITVI|nr:hypothetical protein VITISV_010413 [Vitis vinifera]